VNLIILAAGKPTAGLGIVLGALALVVIAVFFWAVSFRKPEDSRHRRHHWRERKSERHAEESSDEESGMFGSKRRRRRRRHKHRPANPTLAETGGLPPKRTDEEPPRGI
jgi:hypothetical protein